MLNNQDLEQIGQFVRNNLGNWLKESHLTDSGRLQERELNLTERIVRVEEGIKHQSAQIDQMLHQMDKRFSQMFAYFTTGIVMLGVLMSVYQFLS